MLCQKIFQSIVKCLQDISLKNKDDTPYYYRASIWSCLKAKKRMTLQNFYCAAQDITWL